MNAIVLAQKASDWRRVKALVLDSVSSPITKRVYNLGLDEFFEWFGQEPRLGFNKATVSAWRVALEARGLGSISINVRITAVRKLAFEAADNGLLAPELAAGITRIKGVRSKGVRLGNWLSMRLAQALLDTPDLTTKKGLRDRAILAVLLGCGLRRSEVAALTFGHIQQRDRRWCIVDLVGKHGRVITTAERKYLENSIIEDRMEGRFPYWKLFRYRQIWGLIFAKFLSDWAWYLFKVGVHKLDVEYTVGSPTGGSKRIRDIPTAE